jgi:nitroreductase
MRLEEVLFKRKSIRIFNDGEVSDSEITRILNAAEQTPSAGGIHPLEFKVIYPSDMDMKFYNACLRQHVFLHAKISIVISGDFLKMKKKYHRRGIRYVYMEAGHAAQNICLMAVSLGLGSVCIGAFKDGEIKRLLKLEGDPIYIIPIGRI